MIEIAPIPQDNEDYKRGFRVYFRINNGLKYRLTKDTVKEIVKKLNKMLEVVE